MKRLLGLVFCQIIDRTKTHNEESVVKGAHQCYSLSVESVEWEKTAMAMLTSTFIFIVIQVSLQGVQDH